MDRRNFFKQGFDKLAGGAINVAEAHLEHKAKHWIRPPYARQELDFLLACTRCDACIEACPHQVIFPLPLARGAEVVQTPALDLLNKGCHLCEDWPCVDACEPGALEIKLDEADNIGQTDTTNINDNSKDHNLDDKINDNQPHVALPVLAKAEINTDRCLPYSGPECGACQGSCPIPDTLVFNSEKPSINQLQCVGCGLCREACIAEPKAINLRSI